MDNLTPARRSELMRRVRSKNTKPELEVRRILSRLGIRYGLHKRGLPGTPDIVLSTRRIAIFVHGCFWHRHNKSCRLTSNPKSRSEFWREKFDRNRARDTSNQARLKRLGWRIVVVWQCQTSNQDSLERRLKKLLVD
jgi:DNA mismatch endonuclease, patch repair protein